MSRDMSGDWIKRGVSVCVLSTHALETQERSKETRRGRRLAIHKHIERGVVGRESGNTPFCV
jgi:hypothetical protein